MLHKMIEDVRLFHQTFGHPILPKPTIPSPEKQVLRSKLIRDEYIGEFGPAWAKCAEAAKNPQPHDRDPEHTKQLALAEFGDVIADMIYYLIGAALEYGLPLAQIWDAVQEANMSKLWTDQEYWQRSEEQIHWQSTLVEVVAATGSARCWSVKDETGKVRKPPSWKEPNILAIIKGAMNASNNPS